GGPTGALVELGGTGEAGQDARAGVSLELGRPVGAATGVEAAAERPLEERLGGGLTTGLRHGDGHGGALSGGADRRVRSEPARGDRERRIAVAGQPVGQLLEEEGTLLAEVPLLAHRLQRLRRGEGVHAVLVV